MNNTRATYIIWAIVGLTTGVLLGWWQWMSIKKIGPKNPSRIINKIFVFSAVRILLVSGILFIAFRQGLEYGISLLAAFIIGHWAWTLFTIKRNNTHKE